MNDYKEVIGDIELPVLARVLSMFAGIVALRLKGAGIEDDMINVMFDKYLTPTSYDITTGLGFTVEEVMAEMQKLSEDCQTLINADIGGDK